MSAASETKQETKEQALYEASYLIAPSISVEEADAVAGTIATMLTSMGAAIVSAESPKLHPLAYSVGKREKGTRASFDTAYFGHVYFRITPEQTKGLAGTMTELPEVLRALVLATPEEALTPRRAEPIRPRREAPTAEEQKPVNPEELDKQIEQLVV